MRKEEKVITRGDRIAERQKQCTGCQFLNSIRVKERSYGFRSAQNKRLCDMDIWEDCEHYKAKKGVRKKMPRYRVMNQVTKEVHEMEAPFAQVACEKLGWMIRDCHVKCIREGPFTHTEVEIVAEPHKRATQKNEGRG